MTQFTLSTDADRGQDAHKRQTVLIITATLNFVQHATVRGMGRILRLSYVTGWVLHDLPARRSGSLARNYMGSAESRGRQN